jgi:hypothetical protein
MTEQEQKIARYVSDLHAGAVTRSGQITFRRGSEPPIVCSALDPMGIRYQHDADPKIDFQVRVLGDSIEVSGQDVATAEKLLMLVRARLIDREARLRRGDPEEDD